METCNQSHIQAVCVTHRETHFHFANILVECLPNVYIGRATNHLTTDVSQWEHSVISLTVSDSLLQIKNHFCVLLVMCFLTFRGMYIYIYIIYSIYIHLSLKKKTVYF